MPDKSHRMLLFIKDILDSLEKIEEYSSELSFEELKENQMAIDAIIRNFEIIGEAVAHIPDDIKDKYPSVEWKEARSFRNILTHHYFGIDITTVWDTIKTNLPEFKTHILDLYEKETAEAEGDSSQSEESKQGD